MSFNLDYCREQRAPGVWFKEACFGLENQHWPARPDLSEISQHPNRNQAQQRWKLSQVLKHLIFLVTPFLKMDTAFLKCTGSMQLCVFLLPCAIASHWLRGNRWRGRRNIWTRPGCTVWLIALSGSWSFSPWLYQWQLKESVSGKWESPVSRIGQYPNETGLCLLNNVIQFQSHCQGLVVQGSCSFLCACPKVILASSFITVFTFQHICCGLPFLHTPQLFFSHFTFSPGPSFLPLCLTDSPVSPWALTPSSHTQCSASQAFGQGTPLSPSETHYYDCLLLMSASPHHLGKEGKVHKKDGKYISFSFYSILF